MALIGLAICGGTSAGASVVFAEPGQGDARQIAISGPATFVKSRSTNDSKLMRTLFWNPAIQRVLVHTGYRDNFAATPAEIGRGGVVRTNGTRVRGALVFDAESAVVRLRGERGDSKAGYSSSARPAIRRSHSLPTAGSSDLVTSDPPDGSSSARRLRTRACTRDSFFVSEPIVTVRRQSSGSSRPRGSIDGLPSANDRLWSRSP